jgi:hypothetical protein
VIHCYHGTGAPDSFGEFTCLSGGRNRQ